MIHIGRSLSLAVLLLCLAPSLAMAHTGVGTTHGFLSGFGHPIGGLDHILAMAGAGLLAARLGGRALWLVPAAFMAMMAAGGAIGMSGIALPFVETGVLASVVVLGLAIALELPLPAAAAALLAGFFAIFHGHAHGAEMAADVSAVAYGLGFLVTTAALHGAGIGFGIVLDRLTRVNSSRIAQAAGGATAMAGIGLLAGAI